MDEHGWADVQDMFDGINGSSGHALDMELLEKIPPDFLWDDTGDKYVSFIDEQGLIPKRHLYVHISSDMETARKVGSRHGKPVIYEI